MTLDLSLIERPQVQNATPPIGCLKVLISCHWLLLKPCVGIENMFCLEMHQSESVPPSLCRQKKFTGVGCMKYIEI